jgi:hypothetical protein
MGSEIDMALSAGSIVLERGALLVLPLVVLLDLVVRAVEEATGAAEGLTGVVDLGAGLLLLERADLG